MIQPASGPFSDVDDFFDNYFSRVFARTSVFRWCPQWREHPEALVVMQQLWVTWETAQQQIPDGMAVWMRDFAYPLLDRLTVSGGTFEGCRWDKHDPDAEPLP